MKSEWVADNWQQIGGVNKKFEGGIAPADAKPADAKPADAAAPAAAPAEQKK
jgi:hypothetical protein